MLLLNLNPKVDMDLIALCINLALNKRNATLMVENNRLHTLMSRAFKYQDSLLMKLVRNISQHESLRNHFVVNAASKFIFFCYAIDVSNFLILNYLNRILSVIWLKC